MSVIELKRWYYSEQVLVICESRTEQAGIQCETKPDCYGEGKIA